MLKSCVKLKYIVKHLYNFCAVVRGERNHLPKTLTFAFEPSSFVGLLVCKSALFLFINLSPKILTESTQFKYLKFRFVLLDKLHYICITKVVSRNFRQCSSSI